MFLCPGRVRWMNNNKRDNCQVINYFGMGYPETRRGAGVNLCLEGHMAPSPHWSYGTQGTQAVASTETLMSSDEL